MTALLEVRDLKTWFDGRSLREKRLLLGMAALAVLTLLDRKSVV